MNIIVSKVLKDAYNNYLVVDSFEKIKELSKVSCIVVHNFIESDFSAGVCISELAGSGVEHFAYINNDPSIMIRMVIDGVGGIVQDDEFYFEDEDELNSLLEGIGVEFEETGLVVSNMQVISDFVKAFARNDDKIKAPIYLEQVNNAIQNVIDTNNKNELAIKDMGTTALDMFKRANSIILGLESQHKLLQGQIDELNTLQENALSSRAKFDAGVVFFPPCQYLGNYKLLLIREQSPCRYLTSFLLAYHAHVHYDLNKRVKLIFVHQKGVGVSLKYSDFTTITQESAHNMALYDAPIVATNNPKKDVMKNLTSQSNDLIIVVDRLYGNQDILRGKVTKVNAISGLTDLKRYNIVPKDCIFSNIQPPECLLSIPHIKKYPPDPSTRLANYHLVCSDNYKVLDTLMRLI